MNQAGHPLAQQQYSTHFAYTFCPASTLTLLVYAWVIVVSTMNTCNPSKCEHLNMEEVT